MLLKATICTIFTITSLIAGWVSFDRTPVPTPPSIDIISGSRNGLTLKISLHGMVVDDTTVNGVTYQVLSIPECAQISDLGKPMLPYLSKMIAIDPQRQVRLSVDSLEFIVLSNYYVFPAQYPQNDSISQVFPFAIDEALYSRNIFYPGFITEHKRPAIFRDLRVANLSYFPVFFNPQTHQLRVLKNANLRVGFKGTDSINTLPTWPTSVASLYGNIYRSLILNYNTLGIQDETPPKYKYLIISDVSFADALNSFIFWKRKKGLDVVLETITTSEQRDTLYIKNLITFYYNNYRTDYVLLVGDGDEPREQNSYHGPPLLPFAYGWQWEIGGYGYIRSDYWYSTIIGDDDIADVALGRFSVWTPEQLTTVIDKLFSYERYPNASEWFIKSHDLVACSQAEDGYHACKIESIVPIITPFGFQYYDDYGQWASNADVIFHINNSAGPTPQKGVSLVNYRGHGECKAWAYGDDGWNYLYERFRNEEIYQLTNFAGADNAWLPIILEIACSCGRAGVTTYPLSDTTGHSECWFRHKDGGGVAALGATRPSATDPNHKFDAELYRVSFANQQSPHAPVQELGWTINYAKLKMAEAYGWERGSKDNVRMYHLMGDPEIDIYTGWNGYICTTHDSLIPIGPQQFLVKVYDSDENNIVPIPGTLVCLYKENDVYQIQYTDDNGEALFDISPQTIGVMHITATKHDYGPYEGICLVIAEDAGTGRQSETIPYPFSFNHASYLRQSNSVNITYQLPEATCVEISVFDATGRLVKVVEKGLKTEGVNHESWNCRAESGRRVGKGIYFIRLKTAKNETMKKVVIF